MFFENIICGIWMVVISLSLRPCTALSIGALFNLISTGGSKYFLKLLPFMGFGIAAGIAVFGFSFMPESSLATSIACIMFIIGYSSIVSFTGWRFSKNLGERRKRLKLANLDLTQIKDQLWCKMQLAKKIQTVLVVKKI